MDRDLELLWIAAPLLNPAAVRSLLTEIQTLRYMNDIAGHGDLHDRIPLERDHGRRQEAA